VPVAVNRELAYVSRLYLTFQNDLAVLMRVWLHNYLFLTGSINFILLVAAFVWAIVRLRNSFWPAFLAAWFTVLLLLVFIGTQDWRMVLLSFVPGAGLIGILLARLQESLEKTTLPKIHVQRIGGTAAKVLMLLLVVGLAANGPTAYALSHAFSTGQATTQTYIYDSMVWIQANSPLNSSVVSVGLPLEYRYLPLIANRTYFGDFQLNSTGILKLKSTVTFNYVVVSTTFKDLGTFNASNAFRIAYANPSVVVLLVIT
jgi:hypothetical protein